jgi:hypothetical protein
MRMVKLRSKFCCKTCNTAALKRKGASRSNRLNMPPSMKAKLCILALLPLAESSARPPTPQLAYALADAHMVEPEVVARVLREVIRIDHTSTEEGGWSNNDAQCDTAV